MAGSVKKTSTKPKAAAKPRKAAANANGAAVSNGASAKVTEINISREQIAQLAHRFWNERGRQHGHHEEDWFRAEEMLRGKAS